MPKDAHDADLLGSYFHLAIDDITVGFFTGCSGISMEFEPVKFKEGDAKKIVERKRPGRPKYTAVELKRGLTSNKDLYDWFDATVKGTEETKYKTATIIVCDRLGADVAKFRLDRCWPSKLAVSDLSAGKDDVMIETLTIQHELIEWV